MYFTINFSRQIFKKLFVIAILSFGMSHTAAASETAQTTAEKAKIQQQAQSYAICAALSNPQQKQKFSDKLVTLLKKQNQKETKNYTNKQIDTLSASKITELEKNFQEYSPASRQKLHDKLCQGTFEMDENFVGLEFRELPASLQQKMRSIATCAVLSNSFQLKQQAKQLTAANTLIMVAAGLNGREQALSQLTELHDSIIEELKQLSEEQIKTQFKESCEAVKQIQQQRKQQKP